MSTSPQTAAAEASLIGRIDALRAAQPAGDTAAGQGAELATWLKHYLKDEYEVVATRLFVVRGQDFHWGTLASFVGNSVEQPLQACLDTPAWHGPGRDLVQLWRMPGQPYKRIAVATLNDERAKAGDRVVGYFELERLPNFRDAAALQAETQPCPATTGGANR